MKIAFSKLSGAGNDFIVINNLELSVNLSPLQIRSLCARRTGIGADGLIIIEPSPMYDFCMKYHNADGFPGSMCGNGGRCAAYFAHSTKLISSSGNTCVFEANGNRYDARITGHEMVTLKMLAPDEFRYDIIIDGMVCHSVNTGSPHVIVYVPDIEAVNVTTTGRAIRHRTDIFPEGTNVNFVQITSPETLSVRTFERGVENETLACGTGAVAAALMSHSLGKTNSTNMRITVKSGDTLHVDFNDAMDEVFLAGPAKIIFEGSIIT